MIENTGPEGSVDEQTPPPEGDGTRHTQPPDDAETETTPDTQQEQAAAGEAAKYRHKLRDTEKQLAAMTERVQAMQRSEVERLATSKLTDPGDIWRDGAQLADVLDDDGNIDSGKVDGLIDNLVKSHAHWAAAKPQPPRQRAGLTSGATKPADHRQATWADALRHAERSTGRASAGPGRRPTRTARMPQEGQRVTAALPRGNPNTPPERHYIDSPDNGRIRQLDPEPRTSNGAGHPAAD